MKPIEIMPRTVLLDIQPLDLSEYETIIDEFVDTFARQAGVLSIGQCGSVGAPGVSDLDLLIVCEEEKYRVVKLRTQEFARQSPLHHYLFWHDVGVVPPGAVKHLLYGHSLENLKTLWGSPEILQSCDKPDEIITLFREILWNSYFWNLRLYLCQQENASLRVMLMICKSSMIAAASNHRMMGEADRAQAIATLAQQERQHIMEAAPTDQADAAKAFFWEAVQTLARSHWELSCWINQKGLSSGQPVPRKLQLSENHVIVFDDFMNPARLYA